MDLSALVAPDLEDLTICSFCHLTFNENDAVPKLFACRHFFCLKCVNLMLHDGSDDIYCIHCWKRTELQGPEPKADNLPTYNAILYLARNLNTLSPIGTPPGHENGKANHNGLQQQSHRNVGVIGQFSSSSSNAGGSCIIDIDDRDRSPSISSSSGSACGSLVGSSIGGNANGNSSKQNGMIKNGGGGSGGVSNNDFACNVAATGANNCNVEKFKVGENCLTHAMPNTLWCSICRIQLCRACAGTEEHRMHPVKNQIEAKESLHNDISGELQSMQQTLIDLQQLLQKQRDFLVKILESCTTLKTQIETELVNPMPNDEITEIRERLAKAHICLDLLEKQTPGDALKLYTTLHTERQRLLGKYQEMFLQCKLDDLIKTSGFVFDFDCIKKALIRLHNCIVSGDTNNVTSFETLVLSGFGDFNGGLNGLNSINHNPILILANYCISQLYSRQMLALKQQQQQHQQQLQLQQQQSHQIMQQQHEHERIIANNHMSPQQQVQHQYHQHSLAQNHHQQQSLLPNGLLNTMIAHAGLTSASINDNNSNGSTHKTTNDNNNGDTINSTHTTYAQALQQSTATAQKNTQQTGSPNAKTYADIINSANNKRNLQSTTIKQHEQLLTSHQSQSQSMNLNSNFPELAPIGTKTALTTPTSSSSSSSTISSTLSVKRSSTHLFASTNGKKFNGVNLNFHHLQHHTISSQSTSSTSAATNDATKQQVALPPKSPLAINPGIHIYPIYFFNIEMNGKSAGRLLIEVRSDIAPKMAKNFNALVTQEFGFGYKGCQVFQCWENESIITGDYELNNGRGGRSVLEEPFFMPDDTKILAIRGSVGMRRSQKRHDNMGLVGSQFRIILREMRGFTGIFGFLIDGLEVVERIAQTGDTSGKPQSNIVITNCGTHTMRFYFYKTLQERLFNAGLKLVANRKVRQHYLQLQYDQQQIQGRHYIFFNNMFRLIGTFFFHRSRTFFCLLIINH